MAGQISANARSLLDTVSWAEGTWDSKGNRPRYDVTFGYQSVDPSKPHPGRVVRSNGHASDATGAYQFLSTTWKGANGGTNAPMTPENQDRAALELIRRRGVDPDQPLNADSLAKLAPEWASLPAKSGNSYYGQPVKDRAQLLSFYSQRLKGQPAGAPAASTASAPTGAPPVAPASGGGGGGGGELAMIQQLMQIQQGNAMLERDNERFLARSRALQQPFDISSVLGTNRDRKAGQGLAYAINLMGAI